MYGIALITCGLIPLSEVSGRFYFFFIFTIKGKNGDFKKREKNLKETRSIP